MEQIKRMNFTLKFDREIDPKKHYISPGGFEITTSNGLAYQFDFNCYAGNRSKEDSSILEIEMWDLDTITFPESEKIDSMMLVDSKFTEFFVFTGEYDDPEIHPVELLSLEVYFEDENYNSSTITCNLDEINKILTDV